MAFHENMTTLTRVAGQDFTDNEMFCAVGINAQGQAIIQSDPSESVIGIAVTNTPLGEALTVAFSGAVQILLGETLTPGAHVTVGAGGVAVARTSEAQTLLGIILDGGAAGEYGTVLLFQ